MTLKEQQRVSHQASPQERPDVLPFTPYFEMEHLLKVASTVAADADAVWAEIWGEFKRCAGHGGAILPEAEKGFVPSCGWPELLEKFWLLKHYLDSIQRICRKEH